jgi:hypothetical protein
MTSRAAWGEKHASRFVQAKSSRLRRRRTTLPGCPRSLRDRMSQVQHAARRCASSRTSSRVGRVSLHAMQKSFGVPRLTRILPPQDRLLRRIKQPAPKREQCMPRSLAVTVVTITITFTFTGDAARWLSLASNRVSALRRCPRRVSRGSFPLPRRITTPVTRSCS